MGVLVPVLDADAAAAWFAANGGTDEAYLRTAFPRFLSTYRHAAASLPERSVILDLGAHWLHQAFLFADAGHSLICADVPLTFEVAFVRRQAEAMGARLVPYRRLDLGEGITDLPESSVDMVLFSEILEHIAFNPIGMWASVYRVLKPGGRIVVTTPNAAYFDTVYRKLRALLQRGEYGLDVDEIFSTGTYGHHWKEYSIPEVMSYFPALSPDFQVEAHAVSPGTAPDEEAARAHELLQAWRRERARRARWRPWRRNVAIGADIHLPALIGRLTEAGCQPLRRMIIADVLLREKRAGIVLAAPWIPG